MKPAGNMDGPLSRNDTTDTLGTLDEPVAATVIRDLKNVGKKLYYVMLPKARNEAALGLKQWDLWGPLLLCLILSIVLWSEAKKDQREIVFGLVYVIVWLGASVVTLNAQLLGGKLSFFQSVCVLGYCIAPLVICAIVTSYAVPTSLHWINFIIAGAALFWSTGASVTFMSESIPDDRKALAIYPVWLFYVAIAWLILLN